MSLNEFNNTFTMLFYGLVTLKFDVLGVHMNFLILLLVPLIFSLCLYIIRKIKE